MSRPFPLLIFTCLENDGITQDIKTEQPVVFPPCNDNSFRIDKNESTNFFFQSVKCFYSFL